MSNDFKMEIQIVYNNKYYSCTCPLSLLYITLQDQRAIETLNSTTGQH